MAVDDSVIKTAKDVESFSYTFRITGYTFNIIEKSDDKYEIKINNRNFSDLLREERNGKLQREKEEYMRKKDKKRVGRDNGDNKVGWEEDYNIEEQRKILEEFERKKREKMKDNNSYKQKSHNDENNNINSDGRKKKFVLDSKTVNVNRMIINNINDIFGDDNNMGEGGNSNILDLNWDNNNNNNNNNKNDYDRKILDKNPDFYLNQMGNNLNNAKNPHNQAVLEKFFDFSNINSNNFNNNMNYDYNNQNRNQQEINNYRQNNINDNNMNNYIQNRNGKIIDDDFNPFDD